MPPESHRDAISQIRASQKLPPITPPPLPVAIQKRDPKTGAWSASYPDGSINPNARKTFDAAVKAGHDVRSLSLPGGLSAGEVAILGPVGDPPAVANPDRLQPRRVGDKAGPLKDNDVGYLNGQIWTYPVPKKGEGGPVKILFSVVEGAERIYYVGGDRRTPKELFRLPTPASAIAHLVATGKGLRAFYWQYVTSELFDSRLGDSYAGTMGSVQYFGSGVFLGSSVTDIRSEFSDTGGFRNIGSTTRTDWRTNDLETQSFVNAGSAVFTYDGQRTITPFPDPAPKVFPATGTVTDVESSSRTGFFDAGGFRFLSQGSNSTNRLNTTTEFNTDPPTPIVSTWSSSIAENFRQETPLLIGLSGTLKTVQTSSFTSSGSAVLNQNPIIYGPDHGTRLDFVTQDDVVTVSSPQKTLIESRLISPRYSTLAGSTLWVLGDTVSSTVTQLSGGQSFINLLGIDLLSSESAPQKVKIFPIPQGAPLIHSISYTP
jgi:hypothetical protein